MPNRNILPLMKKNTGDWWNILLRAIIQYPCSEQPHARDRETFQFYSNSQRGHNVNFGQGIYASRSSIAISKFYHWFLP